VSLTVAAPRRMEVHPDAQVCLDGLELADAGDGWRVTLWFAGDLNVEGWQASLGLDGSVSMKPAYGTGLAVSIPPQVGAKYRSKGWANETVQPDRPSILTLSPRAYSHARRRGYVRATENSMGPLVREWLWALSDVVRGGEPVTAYYWACGTSGQAVESLGSYASSSDQPPPAVSGPRQPGPRTCLAPVIAQAAKGLSDPRRTARRNLFAFLTDGPSLDDVPQVVEQTAKLRATVGRHSRVVFLLVALDGVDGSLASQLSQASAPPVEWQVRGGADALSPALTVKDLLGADEVVLDGALVRDDRDQELWRLETAVPRKVTLAVPKQAKGLRISVSGLEGTVYQPLG